MGLEPTRLIADDGVRPDPQGSTRLTVTVCVAVAVLPLASVAVHVTVVVEEAFITFQCQSLFH